MKDIIKAEHRGEYPTRYPTPCDTSTTYYIEDLRIDLDWFLGYHVDEEDAEHFIRYLLSREPSKDLKKRWELKDTEAKI